MRDSVPTGIQALSARALTEMKSKLDTAPTMQESHGLIVAHSDDLCSCYRAGAVPTRQMEI